MSPRSYRDPLTGANWGLLKGAAAHIYVGQRVKTQSLAESRLARFRNAYLGDSKHLLRSSKIETFFDPALQLDGKCV